MRGEVFVAAGPASELDDEALAHEVGAILPELGAESIWAHRILYIRKAAVSDQ